MIIPSLNEIHRIVFEELWMQHSPDGRTRGLLYAPLLRGEV